MGPTGKARIVQIHPTRRCNLRCLHCYSASGPEERDLLELTLLCEAVSDAGQEGYNVVSISGGEPMLYRPLGGLLEHAHNLGMLTTVTTNGMLLEVQRLKDLREVTSLLAISLDGMPESHNRVRNSVRAFEQMRARLQLVRDSGIPFGFIFTLTQYNLHELEWVTQFAVSQGAKLLQIHPLEETGRAEEKLAGEKPDAVEATFAYLEVLRMQNMFAGQITIQLDFTNRIALHAEPERFYVSAHTNIEQLPLADLISPLVVEADGSVVPLQYGIARCYALGNLRQTPLRQLAQIWRKNTFTSFQQLCAQVHESAARATDIPFFNWYEAMSEAARASLLPVSIAV